MKKLLIYIIALQLIFMFACKSENTIMYVIARAGLNMRQRKTVHSRIITTIPFNMGVEVLKKGERNVTIGGRTGIWVFVNWNNKKGWVFGSFLSPNAVIVELVKTTKEKVRLPKNEAMIEKIKRPEEYKRLYEEYLRIPKGFGYVEGSVGYPSEYIPQELIFCAVNLITRKIYHKVGTFENKRFKYGTGYKMRVPVGIYIAYSYLPNSSSEGYPVYYYASKKLGKIMFIVYKNKIRAGVNLTDPE